MPASQSPGARLEPAWWSGEQLWFAEGMFRTAPKIKVLDKVPDGRWRVPGLAARGAGLARTPA